MASFNSNRALFLGLLVAVSAFMAAPSSVEAQIIPGLPLPPILPEALPRLLNISGTVFCTPNVTVSANGTLPPNLQPFPNATVMLKCGNTTMANTTTNASGNFNIVSNRFRVACSDYALYLLQLQGGVLNPYLLRGGVLNPSLVQDGECQAIVKEPLSSCNVSLPTRGNLVAQILPMNGTLPVIGGIVNFGVSLFQLLG